MRVWPLLIVSMGLCGNASAQTVYKCKGANGPIFSQMPCGRGHGMQKIEMKPIGKADVDAVAHLHQLEDADARRQREARLDREEDACVDDRSAYAVNSANDRIGSYTQEITALTYKLRLANNNVAGATYESGLRHEIAGLSNAVATERNTIQEAISSARAACHSTRMAADGGH